MRCSNRPREAKALPYGTLHLLFALALLASLTTQAQDLGVIGSVYPIAEPSLLEVIQARLHEGVASGALARLQRESQARITQEIAHPAPLAGLATTTHARSFHFDPSIVVPFPVSDAEGRVLIAPGTRNNPLDTVTFSESNAKPVDRANGTAAMAQDKPKKEPSEKQKAQQERMKSCNDKASDKKGDDRKKFMSSCLKGEDAGAADKQKAQQQKMTDCNKQAGDKKMQGDARKTFMSTCLKG